MFNFVSSTVPANHLAPACAKATTGTVMIKCGPSIGHVTGIWKVFTIKSEHREFIKYRILTVENIISSYVTACYMQRYTCTTRVLLRTFEKRCHNECKVHVSCFFICGILTGHELFELFDIISVYCMCVFNSLGLATPRFVEELGPKWIR